MKKNIRKNRRNRGGFTLLEVTIVLFIIVAIMGLAVVNVLRVQANAQRKTAQTYVKALEEAVELYTASIGYPPTTDQGLAALVICPADIDNPGAWAGPYLKSTATSRDPWGNEYQYISPGRNGDFDIWSFGPDRIDGTDDDIGNWTTGP